MQNNNEKKCIEHIYPTIFPQTSTCDGKNGNLRWIWTNYGQLLNWQNLKCMRDDFNSRENLYFQKMKDCDRNDKKQLWECVGDKKYNIKQTQSGRYLYYGEYATYVTTKATTHMKATIWTRLGSEKDVCSQGEILQVRNNCKGKKQKPK